MTRSTALLLVLALAGCDGYEPPPAPPDPDPMPADPLEARIRQRAPTDAPYMQRREDARHFTIAEGQSASFALIVAGGLCYKVLAQADEGVSELDMMLYREDGVLVQEDTTHGSGAVLGTAQPICPQDPASLRVELRAVHGHGAVAAQLYVSP
jgi:hypothetical protein